MTEMETILIFILMGYLIGSFPSGLVYTRLAGMEDIRNLGSGNIGATNVGRVLGKKYGLICFFLDVLKGAVPVLVVGMVSSVFGQSIEDTGTTDMLLWISVALASLLGHMYSVFLKFGGGKGVATTFGGMVAERTAFIFPCVIDI